MSLPSFARSNTQTTWLAQLVKALPYVGAPVAINNIFTDDFNALWLVIMNTTGLIAFFDAGLLHNFARRIAYTTGKKDNDLLADLIQVASSIYFSLSIILVVYGLVYYQLLLVNNSNISVDNQDVIWGFSIIAIATRFYANSLQALFFGLNRVYIFRWIEIFWYSIMFFGQIVGILCADESIFYMSFIAGCFGIALSGLAVKRLFFSLERPDRKLNYSLFREMLLKAALASVGQGWTTILPIILASWLVVSTDAKTAYFVMVYVSTSRFTMLFCRTPFNTCLPVLSSKWAKVGRFEISDFYGAAWTVTILTFCVFLVGLSVTFFLETYYPDLAPSFVYLLFMALACASAEAFVGMCIQSYQVTDDIISHRVNGLTIAPMLITLCLLSFSGVALSVSDLLMIYLGFLSLVSFPISLHFLRRILPIKRCSGLFSAFVLLPITISLAGYVL